MAESTDKTDGRKRWRISPILTSAFVLSILTAMFFLQGRALREGWLRHFGLESAQFPISTTDTYWLALHGWLKTAVGWFNNAWDFYLGYLPKLILPLAMLAFGMYAWEWFKARRDRTTAENEAEEASEPAGNIARGWLTADGWKAWATRAGVALVAAPIGLAVFPLMLFLAGLLLAALIGTAVVPFDKAGKQMASDFCERPVTRAARIVLTDGSGHPEWGYRIECNQTVCAMIRDGRVYVVPTRNVERIELPSLLNKIDPKQDDESGQERLCPVPDDSASVPA